MKYPYKKMKAGRRFHPVVQVNEHRESNDTDGASEVISDENVIQGK